ADAGVAAAGAHGATGRDARAAGARAGHDHRPGAGDQPVPPRPRVGDRRRGAASYRDLMRIAPLSGFPEWLPGDRIVEQRVIDTVRSVFELHGFTPIETRSVEPLDELLRKGETDKEI